MIDANRTQQIHAKAQAKVETATQPKRAKAAAAGARSTYAAPLTYEQRAERYVWQNYTSPLTPRQMRRIAKKVDRLFYRMQQIQESS